MSIFRSRAAAIVVLGLAFSIPGCREGFAGGAPGPCTTGTTQVFLHSKLDDDDGDGNPYDEDFPRINDEDDDIADHAWARDRDGVFHLFFQNESGMAIEHYTSRDLQNLTYVGVALAPHPGAWDCCGLWAPHIVHSGDIYLMFYTGIDGPPTNPATRQRIGLATSSDLTSWTRAPLRNFSDAPGVGCVYECREGWTTWGGPSGSHNQQCRDPFVIRDTEHQRWVLFATAKSTNGFGVVTVAYSNDLATWTGAGYIHATRRFASGIGGQPTGGQAENPQVVAHDGTFYLLFTDWQDAEDSWTVANPRTIVQYATSPTLVADSLGSNNWTYRGYTPDPGVNAIEAQVLDTGAVLLSESISNPNSPDHPEHRRELRLKSVTWGPGYGFTTENWPPPCGQQPAVR